MLPHNSFFTFPKRRHGQDFDPNKLDNLRSRLHRHRVAG
jgi:hypothetical protein